MAKRLRFNCEFIDGESIVGAVYRATSRHALPSIFPVLREAGIPRKSVNFIQLLSKEQIAALADIIRCDPDRLGRDAGVRQGNAAPDERGRQRIRFGELMIEGCHLDHRSRRFSSSSLRASPHHRTDWLNRLLPYCPFSFELLHDACPSCSEKLGWTKPFEISFCENCETDLLGFSAPFLEHSLRRDYRAFAELCSLEQHRRKAVLDSLPSSIRNTPPGTLVRTVLHVGQFVCGNDPVPETHLSRLPPSDLAQIVSTGMRSLHEWPDHFQSWVASEANKRRNDRSRYSALNRSLRLFARQIEKEPGGQKLIANVLPGFVPGASNTAEPVGAHYSMAAAKKRLQTDYNRIRMLCDKGLIKNSVFERSDGTISRMLLDAGRVDQIAYDLDRVVHHWEFWTAFRLPSYAIEQLICLEVIKGLTDQAIVALRNEAMIPRGELDQLTHAIKKRARKSSPPSSARSLRVLSHEIGGRMKPWGIIWKALINGDLPFWTRREGSSTQHILVQPDAWANLKAMSFDRHAFPDFPFKTFMNNCDLSEILNLQPKETIAIRQDGLLEPKAYKLTLRYEVEDVLDLAVRYVSTTELMRRSGQTKKIVIQRLENVSVATRSCLWERVAAETAVLPS